MSLAGWMDRMDPASPVSLVNAVTGAQDASRFSSEAAPARSRRSMLGALGGLGAGALLGGCARGESGPSPRTLAEARTLLSRQGRFGAVEVLALDSLRALAFVNDRGRMLQGAVDLADPQRLVIAYCRLMMLAAAYAARFDEVAMIGLGTGAMAGYVARTYAPARLQVAEIDPLIVELAATHFGLRPAPGLQVLTQDGRAMLAAGGRPYDAILIDAYGGQEIPEPLVTRQFYEIVRARLAPDGAYVQNLVASARRFDSILATIAAVFPTIATYRTGGNWVIVALPGPGVPDDVLAERVERLDARHAPRHRLVDQLALADVPAPFRQAPVLLDPAS